MCACASCTSRRYYWREAFVLLRAFECATTFEVGVQIWHVACAVVCVCAMVCYLEVLWCDEAVSGVHVPHVRLCLLPQTVHLCRHLPHEWIKLFQEIVALVEERELGTHV